MNGRTWKRRPRSRWPRARRTWCSWGRAWAGGIVVSFLYNSVAASRVKGIILDGPVLNFDAVVDYGASQRYVFGVPLPGALTGLAKFLAALRFGVDFHKTNYLKRVDELSVPVLLFHGSEDLSVPESLSAQFKEARPDIVEYHLFEDAAHVGSWNLDPQRYEDAVHSFLRAFGLTPFRGAPRLCRRPRSRGDRFGFR